MILIALYITQENSKVLLNATFCMLIREQTIIICNIMSNLYLYGNIYKQTTQYKNDLPFVYIIL